MDNIKIPEDRPYIINFMIQSVDGKVTGDWYELPEGEFAMKDYIEKEDFLKADAFLNGINTYLATYVRENFTPDLTSFKGKKANKNEDYKSDKKCKMYAICFDRKGRCPFAQSSFESKLLPRENVEVISVLSELASDEYILYLKSIGLSYIFAGKDDIDIKVALKKLKDIFGINKILMEGGPTLNGAFLKENLLDELVLYISPLISGNDNDKPLYINGTVRPLDLVGTFVNKDGTLLLRYKFKK